MDFNEYWKNGCFGDYHDIYSKNLADKFYNAGQQSKQEEVNKLQKEIDALNEKLNKSKRVIKKQYEEVDYWADLAFDHIMEELDR